MGVFVIWGHMEGAFFQAFYVHDQAAIFCMQEFHGGTAAIYKDEDITHTDVLLHPVLYDSAQGVHAFAHVGLTGAKVVAHGVIQAEHGCEGFGTGKGWLTEGR